MKLIQPHYKVLHRISTCRYMRFKMNIVKDTPLCVLCKDKLETLRHIYIECPVTAAFLVRVNVFIRGNIDTTYDDPTRYFLITLSHRENKINFINAVLQWYISKRFQNNLPPNWESFIYHIRRFLTGEKREIVEGIQDLVSH